MCPDMHNQLSKIMQFNRSLEPLDDCGQATRRYDNGHGEPIEIKTSAGGFSLDLLEPRPLAPPENRYIVTDRIEISMLQLGFQTSNKDQEVSFSSINVPSQQSQETRSQGYFASALRNHLSSLQSSNSRTNTIDHHADVVIHASRLPPPSDNMTVVTPGISSPSHVVDIQDYHLRLESMPSGESSVGSQASAHDHRRFEKSASFSSISSSFCVPHSETITVHYHSQSDEQWMEKFHELEAFFRVHGHSKVPSVFPENQALANWVKRARVQYKLLHQTSQNGHSSTLTKERAELLSAVDFQTNMRALSWQKQYEKLVSFKEKHGHVRVSLQDDPSLCNWIKRQRKLCREFFNGKGSMTAEQIKMLRLVDLLCTSLGT